METVTDSPQDPDPEGHFQFGVIVLGDTAVGKSLLLRCFTDRPGGGPGGVTTPSPTTGIEFYRQTILMPAGKAKLQLWDTAGQEQFTSITRSFYRSAAGVVLVFDLANQASFEHIPEWYRKAAGDWPLAFVLVGHKCDLVAKQAVSAEEAGHLATNLGAWPLWRPQPAANFNRELAFQTLAGGINQTLGQGILARHQGCDGIRLTPNQSHHQPPGGREPQERCQC